MATKRTYRSGWVDVVCFGQSDLREARRLLESTPLSTKDIATLIQQATQKLDRKIVDPKHCFELRKRHVRLAVFDNENDVLTASIIPANPQPESVDHSGDY